MQKCRILFLDDERASVQPLRHRFIKYSYAVQAASSSPSVFPEIDAKPPHPLTPTQNVNERREQEVFPPNALLRRASSPGEVNEGWV